MVKMTLGLIVLSNLLLATWTGFDHKNSRFIQIDKNELVRSSGIIEYMDADTFTYYPAEVISVEKAWGKIEVRLYDLKTEEEFTASMESSD